MPTKTWIEVPIDQEVWGVPEEGYSPHFFPPEGDYLLFHFTEESFLRVLSALINGAALTYPDTWLQVVWDFLKNVDYPVNACSWLANLIETCPEVRDSIFGVMQEGIGNVPSVQNAFYEWLAASDDVRELLDQRYNVPTLNDQVATSSILKPDECGDDYIFNQATVLVDLLNTVVEDMFEAVEVGTNQLERWGIFSSALPGVGQLIPIDEALAFINQLVEEMSEDYEGAYNLTLRDTLRCDIFCIAQGDCSLSIEDVITYYEGKIGSISLEDPATTVQQIVSFIATGDFPGDLPVYLAHLLVLALIRLSQNVFGIDFATLSIQIVAAGDTANNDWTLICDECPTEICVDLTTGANGWFAGDENGNPTSVFGGFISGEGMAPNQTTGGFNVGINAGDMPAGDITALKFIFNQNIEDGLYMARWGSDAFQFNPDVANEIIFNELNTTSYFPFDSSVLSVRITTPSNIAPTSLRLIGVCYMVG